MRFKSFTMLALLFVCGSTLWGGTKSAACQISDKMSDDLCSKWDLYTEDDFMPIGIVIKKPAFPDPPAKDTAYPAEYQEYREWVRDSTQKYLDEKADEIKSLFANYPLYVLPVGDPWCWFFVDPADSSLQAMKPDSVFTDTVRLLPDSIGIEYIYEVAARKSVCGKLIEEPIIETLVWSGIATLEAGHPAKRAVQRPSKNRAPYKLIFGNVQKKASAARYDLKGRQLLNAPVEAGKNAKMLILSQ